MSNCAKCGTEVSEEMKFCPKCGASLKVEPVPAEPVSPAPYRAEKAEKQEKTEKEEKYEKREKEVRYEKRESSFIGPLIGGLILIFLGLMFYFAVTASLRWETAGAVFFILVGIVIIIGAVYAAVIATRRHPKI